MPAPKKGKRFGKSASHQKLMLANLAAHLIISRPTRSPRPRRRPRRCARTSRSSSPRPRSAACTSSVRSSSTHPRQGRRAQALRRDRSALHRPQRRLHADPEARPAPGRQRPHGAHRIRLAASGPRTDDASFERAAPKRPALFDASVRAGEGEDGRRVRRHRLQRLRGAAQPAGRAHGRRRARRRRSRKVLRHEVELTCAGRTDAGVHAWGQVVSFASEPGLDEWRLQSAVNSMLGPEVVVRSCEIVAPELRRAARRGAGAGTATRSSTGRCPTRSATGSCGGSREPLDLQRAPARGRPVRRRARLRRRSAARDRKARR